MSAVRAVVIALALLPALTAVPTPAAGAGTGRSAPAVVDVPLDLSAPEVSASASPSLVRLGQPFTLFVTAIADRGVTCNLQEPLDLGGAFEVGTKVSRDQPRADGKVIREWQIQVLAWELGELQLPPVAVTFVAGGAGGQVATTPVPLRVIGVVGEADDGTLLRGLAPPRELMVRTWWWMWPVAAVVLVLVASGWLVRRRRLVAGAAAVRAEVVARPLDSLEHRTLAALAALGSSAELRADPRAWHRALASILGDYLAARHHVVTHERTTLEILAALGRRVGPDERAWWRAWYAAVDAGRYGSGGTAVEGERNLADARRLVTGRGADA